MTTGLLAATAYSATANGFTRIALIQKLKMQHRTNPQSYAIMRSSDWGIFYAHLSLC